MTGADGNTRLPSPLGAEVIEQEPNAPEAWVGSAHGRQSCYRLKGSNLGLPSVVILKETTGMPEPWVLGGTEMNEVEQKPIEQTSEQVPETTPTVTAIEDQEGTEQQDVTAVEVPRPTAAPEAKKEVPKGARSYELIFLVDAGLPKEELDGVIGKVQTFLEQRNGVVDNVRVSDVRRLAYPIKKRTHGIYVVVNFWLNPNLIAELERMLRLEERVLRHMVIQIRG